MMKWLLTVLVVLIALSLIAPRFSRYGFGRLPGDFRVPARGRIYYIPFMSTVLLTLLVWALSRLI